MIKQIIDFSVIANCTTLSDQKIRDFAIDANRRLSTQHIASPKENINLPQVGMPGFKQVKAKVEEAKPKTVEDQATIMVDFYNFLEKTKVSASDYNILLNIAPGIMFPLAAKAFFEKIRK